MSVSIFEFSVFSVIRNLLRKNVRRASSGDALIRYFPNQIFPVIFPHYFYRLSLTAEGVGVILFAVHAAISENEANEEIVKPTGGVGVPARVPRGKPTQTLHLKKEKVRRRSACSLRGRGRSRSQWHAFSLRFTPAGTPALPVIALFFDFMKYSINCDC